MQSGRHMLRVVMYQPRVSKSVLDSAVTTSGTEASSMKSNRLLPALTSIIIYFFIGLC